MVSRSRLRNRFWFLGGVLAVLAGAALLIALWPYSGQQPAPAAAELSENSSPDHLVGSFSTIVDEQGEVLSMMARTVFAGDELYTCEGRIYRIKNVEGDRAEAGICGHGPPDSSLPGVLRGTKRACLLPLSWPSREKAAWPFITPTRTNPMCPVMVKNPYPLRAGSTRWAKPWWISSKAKGLQVHYDETPHDPHDNNAYTCSAGRLSIC